MSNRVTSTLIILFAVVVASGVAQSHAPFEGKQKNSHGDIRWKSSVGQSSGSNNWVYRNEVWNNDQERNCKVAWLVAGIDSLIPPGKSVFVENDLPSRPMERSSELRVAGGSASGEYVISDARAWVPEGSKITAASKAQIFSDLEGNGILSEVEITSSSIFQEIDGGWNNLTYNFEIKGLPEKMLGREVKVSWSSGGMEGAKPQSSDSPDALRFEGRSHLQATLETTRMAELRVGFIILASEDGRFLGRAAAPVLVPAGSGQTIDIFERASTHGRELTPLSRLAGTWTFTSKAWAAPGQSAMESSGIVSSNWTLGGRYLESNYSSLTMGMPIEVRSIGGYDKASGYYVSTSIDSMGTGIQYTRGTCDVFCNTLTWDGEVADPMAGQKIDYKEVLKFIDDDTYTYEVYITGPEGKLIKTAEMTAKRLNSPIPPSQQ